MEPAARRRSVPVLSMFVGLGLLSLGAGLVVIGASRPGPSIAAAGPEKPIAAGASDPADLRTHNSPTLARDPTDPQHLVVVNRIDLPQYSCALHRSSDGGATWEAAPIPFPAGEELPERCFAPDAAFDSAGTLYVSFATLQGLGNRPNAIWISSMARGEPALSTPRFVLGPLAFQVRLTADPRAAGTVYLSWLQADAVGRALFPNTGNPITLRKSEDGGTTWGEPIRVSPPARQRVVAPSLVSAGAGRLWVLYLDLGEDKLDYHGAHEFKAGEPYAGTFSLVLARSGDDGATWRETVVDDRVVPTHRFLVFLPQSPSLAVDAARDRVFVGFADGRLGDSDVWVRASTDAGATFGARRRVNDTRERDGTWQYLPRLAVAPSGRLDAVYYDRRSDPSNVRNEVSFQSSFDGSRTFTPSRRLSSVSFDSRIGFGSRRGLADLGSRLGLLAEDDRSLAVWTDTRAGTSEAEKQDLALAEVRIGAEDGLRSPMRTGGTTLAVAGGLALAWSALVWARRRPAPRPPGAAPAGDPGAEGREGA